MVYSISSIRIYICTRRVRHHIAGPADAAACHFFLISISFICIFVYVAAAQIAGNGDIIDSFTALSLPPEKGEPPPHTAHLLYALRLENL